MVNYYNLLKVSPDATTAEIKSAYRKLARKTHPDVNDGNEDSSRKFAQIAMAYKILSDPQNRVCYDKQRLKVKFSHNSPVFDLENPHASRAKQVMYERRYNAIIDKMIAEERLESIALQQLIFPVVSLFISTSFVAIFKPLFWSNSSMIGKIALLTLFIVGVLHLLKRLHAGFERYTYSSVNIDDSLLGKTQQDKRPYSRSRAISFLIAGIVFSLLLGLIISSLLGMMTSRTVPNLFAHTLRLEFLFYPPIVVLLVDLMHSFATRLEQKT